MTDQPTPQTDAWDALASELYGWTDEGREAVQEVLRRHRAAIEAQARTETPDLSDVVAKARADGADIEPGWMDEEQPTPQTEAGLRASETWLPIEGKWHHITVVIRDNGFPDWFVDGERPAVQGDTAAYDKALDGETIARHYREAVPSSLAQARTEAPDADLLAANIQTVVDEAVAQARTEALDGSEYERGWRDGQRAHRQADGTWTARTEALDVDAPTLARAMRECDGVNWPRRWFDAEHNFDWVARQVAAQYRAIKADR